MPRRGSSDDSAADLSELVLSSSDSDFLDQFIFVLKDAGDSHRTPALIRCLAQHSRDCEGDIDRILLTKFPNIVENLQSAHKETVTSTTDILDLSQTVQASSQKLANLKQALVSTKAIRQNITDASAALNDSLKILHAVNQAHELARVQKSRQPRYYAALKLLDDLQNEHLVPILQSRHTPHHALAYAAQKSIPALQESISEAVMKDLSLWLSFVRESTQLLGEVAFYHTELRRTRHRKRTEDDAFLGNFKFNSAIERVCDEDDEFDVLDNEELHVDFTPLLQALHIDEALGQTGKFRAEYAATRRHQKDLLIPTSVDLLSEDESSLVSLLEGIAGFAIIEKATMRIVPHLRSPVDVEEIWESMCNSVIDLSSKALSSVINAEELLKIKGRIVLFIHTMEGWGYSVSSLDSFLLTLVEKYAELLRNRFSEDFQEIVSADDFMPMAINSAEEYEKIVEVSWFTHEKSADELNFPCVLPFSQMYPLCCINVRNFLKQFYFFSDDYFQHPDVIDETLKKSLDALLTETVCQCLVERLSSQYLGQTVQILINLEHFETACRELEQLLILARSSTSAGGPLRLNATDVFQNNKKAAEKRIFELVNSKIDDLVDTAEYEWTASSPSTEPSSYMQTLTRYLESIMSSTLLALPREIKELIYFDALSHAADKILALPLSDEVKHITPPGVSALALDVQYLIAFIDSLENGQMLRQNLDELQQTVDLMQAENTDDYFDISTRNKKYGRVNAQYAPILVEKLTPVSSFPSKGAASLANFSSRFNMMR